VLAEHVYSQGLAHTHEPDNTITSWAIPLLRASGYEPGDALLALQISSQSVQAISSLDLLIHLSSNPPALYAQTLSLQKAISNRWQHLQPVSGLPQIPAKSESQFLRTSKSGNSTLRGCKLYFPALAYPYSQTRDLYLCIRLRVLTPTHFRHSFKFLSRE